MIIRSAKVSMVMFLPFMSLVLLSQVSTFLGYEEM